MAGLSIIIKAEHGGASHTERCARPGMSYEPAARMILHPSTYVGICGHFLLMKFDVPASRC